MTLNRRIVLTIAITVGLSLAMAMLGLWFVLDWGMRGTLNQMMDGFSAIEKDNSDRDLRRVQDAYQQLLLSTESRMLDWAKWDDSWNYAVDHNPEFIKSNLPPSVIAGIGYSQVLIYDTLGTLLSFVSVDAVTGITQPLPAGISELKNPKSPFKLMHNVDDVSSGLIDLPEGPLLYSARPIVQSSGQGPIHGTIVFTRFFDSVQVAHIADLTHLSIRIKHVSDIDSIESSHYPRWEVVSDSLQIGELLMRDYLGVPCYQMSVQINRAVRIRALDTFDDITKAATDLNWILMFSTLCCGLGLMVMLTMLIRRLLITRLQLLATSIEQVRDTGITDARIPSMGRDEIGVLANEFNRMLDSLSHAHISIHEQNLDRKTTLDAIPLGLINLNRQCRVVGHPSRTAINWFGENCVQMPLAKLLALDQKQTLQLEEFLDVLTLGLLSNNDMHGLNPIPEIQLPSHDELWVRTTFYRLPSADNLDAQVQESEPLLLAVLEDITETRHKKSELNALGAENTWLRAVVADPELFLEFFRESKISMDIVESALTGTTNHTSVARAYRPVHTIQGCASGFGIQTITVAAIALEDQLSALLECFEKYQMPPLYIYENGSRKALENLRAVLRHEEQRLLDILHQQSTDWKSGPSLKVPLHRLREWSALLASGEYTEVQSDMENSLRMPLTQILHRTLLWFPGMALRSGKQASLQIEGSDVMLPMDWSGILNDILVHLLRNSLAHGIESVEERIMVGKPEVGSIKISGAFLEDRLFITIHDDGRGFDIDVDKALTFGVSSRAQASEIAGRGVGLPAVLTMVEEIGGKLEITSNPGKGAQICISFDLSPQTLIGSD